MIEAQPSRTAMRVALRRAAHQQVDAKPLVFDDPLATAIVGREGRAELERTPDAVRKPFSAGLRAWMVTRARFAEDVLDAQVRRGLAAQYLVLGAGLDTFACRNPHSGLRVFEVDFPATQAWKRERLAEAGLTLPSEATLVAVDFERQELATELRAAGFDPALPTVTAWLGVVPYLTLEAFRHTCALLGRFAPGSEVVFDYSQPREVLSEREQLMLDSMAARVAQAGEPFQLFFKPEQLAVELHALNLGVVEDLGAPDLHARYLRDRTDGLMLRGAGGRLCRASSR